MSDAGAPGAATGARGRAGSAPGRPVFFPDAEAFDRWLTEHGATEAELQVGYHRRATGLPSLTWAESVDVALCHGWIDGVRRRVDETRYTIRFTPRRARSIWSNVNVARVAALEAAGRMRDAGRAAFALRSPERTGVYGTEQRNPVLGHAYREALDADPAVAAWFEAQPPSYRRPVIHWVMSAKAETTRRRRLDLLIDCCRRGERVPQFTWRPAAPAEPGTGS